MPSTSEELIGRYRRAAGKKFILMAVCVAGVILTVGLLSVSVYNSLTLSEAYSIIWNHIIGTEYEPRSPEWWADMYIWNRALPRAAIAIVAGASLAVSGALMQALMNNPLADPYSTGISSGACFGAVGAIVMGFTFASLSGEMGIVTNAFIGAMVPALLIIVIAKKISMSPATLILIGTALSYFFNSMVTYIMVMSDAEALQDAYLWQVGSLDGVTWASLPLMLGVTVIGSIVMISMSKQLNVMSLGDANAKTLGLDVENFKILCLTLMAIMTCAVISYTGIIGFIGLVAPHIIRMLIGSDNRFVLPMSMSVGALLFLVADYIAINLNNIPVGVVMAIIGSPIFLALIIWQKKSYGAIY